MSSAEDLPITSVAVLPFQNMKADQETEYLSDGLAESLIYGLSQLPDFKVSPTSSVFRYKGKEIDAIEIGNELGVNAVITGRVAQRGEDLTISVELVDVRNKKLLWAKQYDRKLVAPLATQREIATQIAQNLKNEIVGRGCDDDDDQAFRKELGGLSVISERALLRVEIHQGGF